MPTPTILAIWKPKGPTSHDVVDAVRRITDERRVGHAGTLDPMAEGVLVIGIGREATKQLASIVAKEKEYVAMVQLGATSTTDDAEGEITPTPTPDASVGTSFSPSLGEGEREGVGRMEIERTLKHFLGHIEQVPPAYSAVKVRGKPAHRRMRAGEEVHLKSRTVEIKEIDLLKFQISNFKSQISLRIVCGPGTYIRALARDIGRALGVGGYLTALTRTRVGTYTRENALTIEQFRERWP